MGIFSSIESGFSSVTSEFSGLFGGLFGGLGLVYLAVVRLVHLVHRGLFI